MRTTFMRIAAMVAIVLMAALPGQGGPATAADKAADLRVLLNALFAEHIALASNATGAALGARPVEFRAAATTLDRNSDDLIRAIGSLYGPAGAKAFGDGWKQHIGFFVDYTTGLGAKDHGKQEKARAELFAYAKQLGAFLNAATKTLPADAVAELVRGHVNTLTEVIDSQAQNDQTEAYTRLRHATAHMHKIADPLSDAIVRQFPDRFGR